MTLKCKVLVETGPATGPSSRAHHPVAGLAEQSLQTPDTMWWHVWAWNATVSLFWE